MVHATLLDAPETSADAVSAEAPVTRESLGRHIIAEITRCNGPQLKCYSDQQIIDAFWDRFGPDGMLICHQAFSVHNGMWRGAPVTIMRFQPHHDPYFSAPLLGEARGAQGNHE